MAIPALPLRTLEPTSFRDLRLSKRHRHEYGRRRELRPPRDRARRRLPCKQLRLSRHEPRQQLRRDRREGRRRLPRTRPARHRKRCATSLARRRTCSAWRRMTPPRAPRHRRSAETITRVESFDARRSVQVPFQLDLAELGLDLSGSASSLRTIDAINSSYVDRTFLRGADRSASAS